MTEYVSNTTLTSLADVVGGASRIMVTSHAKPDGDAVGSVVALTCALRNLGKTVTPLFMPPINNSLHVILRNVDPVVYDPNENMCLPDDFDLIIVCDTGAWSQLEPLRDYLADKYERTIILDHHQHGDDVGAAKYIDKDAAAACEVVAEFVDELNVNFDKNICEALYVGVATDTGWFRFSNARPFTHELAARLIRGGVDHAVLYKQLEQAERPQKLKLLVRAMQSVEIIADGKAVVMTLRVRDFVETGAWPEETERLVDIPQIVNDVEVVVLITEQSEGPTRMSFRSKPGSSPVNVSDLAQRFGGGGHEKAAGAKLDLPVDDVRERVIEEIQRLFL